MDGNQGPDWLREAAAAVRDETVRYVTTVLRCTAHPRRFAAAWFRGATRAPNPLGYVSTALAVTAAAKAVTWALLGRQDDSGLWSGIAAATLPYTYYALLGVLAHLVLRSRATRRPLRASLAIALYIGGGPGLFLTLGIHIDLLFYFLVTGESTLANGFMGGPAWAIPILLLIAMGGAGLFLATLASAFRGLHDGSRLRTLCAIFFALVASAVLLGALHTVFDFVLSVPHFVFRIGTGKFDIWF